MRVSVIVPVYNNATTIAQCLESLLASSYRIEEIIVVNDHSTDATPLILKRFPCKILNLRRNSGVGVARNAGAKLATGDVLFYTDGDVSTGERTIEIGVDTLTRRPDAAAVTGLYSKICGADNFVSVFKNLVYHYVHMSSTEKSQIFIGNCGMIRRNILRHVGGFEGDSEFKRCLEDIDLGMRMTKLGYTIVLNKDMQVVHHKRFAFFGLLYSDLFKRAIPWTKLILKHRAVKLDNCTSGKDLVCLAAAYLAVASALSAFIVGDIALVLAVVFAMTVLGAEFRLYRFLLQEKGRLFTIGAAGMRYLYYLVGGIGAMAGFSSYVFSQAIRRVRGA